MFFELKEAKDGKILNQKNEKSKTVAVIIAMCLNLGINPPDLIKPEDCAKLLTWQTPKNTDSIIRNLQLQYQLWHPRAKYKLLPDPSLDDLKKVCVALRKAAKFDRILIHYNGYGVPKPTQNGEIWVFNKQYTQYLPVSLHDLIHWTQSPSIFVWDCNNAGSLITSYKKFAEQKDKDTIPEMAKLCDNIQFAACQANEQLPLQPDVPADFFTSCLTTPIIIALRCWAVENKERYPTIDLNKLVDFPGKLNDRKTPLGELNWIFTAVVDTIAWSLFPREDFKKLFRNDLLVAALYRNFLLAQKLMRQYGCTPVCDPPISIYSYRHHLWLQWELVLDHAINQFPQIHTTPETYVHSSFFSDQLTAFEIWLDQKTTLIKSPEQLPILLQVLLSQAHRSRALILLAKFLDLGSWAINEALSVGIFPYCLKLLQSPAPELRPVLSFIWARLLSIERDFQNDIVKDNGFLYFFQGFSKTLNTGEDMFSKLYLTNCAFVLSQFTYNHTVGKDLCMKSGLVQILCRQLSVTEDNLAIEWLLYALSSICLDFKPAIQIASQENCIPLILPHLQHKIPRIRAAVLNLTTSLFSIDCFEQDVLLQLICKSLYCVVDLNVLVRHELLCFVSKILNTFPKELSSVIHQHLTKISNSLTIHSKSTCSENEFLESVWRTLLIFTTDPHEDIKLEAQQCLDAHMIYFHSLNNSNLNVPPMIKTIIKHCQTPELRKNKSFYSLGFTTSSTTMNDVYKVITTKTNTLIASKSFLYASLLMCCTSECSFNIEFDSKYQQVYSFFKNKHLNESKSHHFTNLQESLRISTDSVCDGFSFHESLDQFCTYSKYGNCYIYQDNQLLYTLQMSNQLLNNALFVNQQASSMVLSTYIDGAITIHKGNESTYKQIYGGRPLTDLIFPSPATNILTSWDEQNGMLYMTGSCKVIRTFDLHSELKMAEIHSRSTFDCTSFSQNGHLLMTGYKDGMVRLFDVRSNSNVFSSKAHHQKVLQSKLQSYGKYVATCSEDGELKLWDIRAMSLPLSTSKYDDVISCDIHEVMPLVCLSTKDGVQCVTINDAKHQSDTVQTDFFSKSTNQWIHNTNTQEIVHYPMIKSYSGLLGPKMSNELAMFQSIVVPTLYVAYAKSIIVYK